MIKRMIHITLSVLIGSLLLAAVIFGLLGVCVGIEQLSEHLSEHWKTTILFVLLAFGATACLVALYKAGSIVLNSFGIKNK